MSNDPIAADIRRQAFKETNQFVFGAKSAGGVVMRLVLLCGYLATVGGLFSVIEAQEESWKVIAALAPPVLLYPVFFLIKRDQAQRQTIVAVTTDNARLSEKRGADIQLRPSQVGQGCLTPDPAGPKVFFVLLTAINTGSAPSACLAWRMRLINDGRHQHLEVTHPVAPVNFGPSEGNARFFPSDAIYEKTAVPIAAGAFTSGFLMGVLSDPAQINEEGSLAIIVECDQIDGRTVSTEASLGEETKAAFRYVPGMEYNVGKETPRGAK